MAAFALDKEALEKMFDMPRSLSDTFRNEEMYPEEEFKGKSATKELIILDIINFLVGWTIEDKTIYIKTKTNYYKMDLPIGDLSTVGYEGQFESFIFCWIYNKTVDEAFFILLESRDFLNWVYSFFAYQGKGTMELYLNGRA